MAINFRERRVPPPSKRRVYVVGELVGPQHTLKLLAKGTRNGQIAWSLVCTGCGTNPGMVTEDKLDLYKCPSSICTGTSRIEGDDRCYKDYRPKGDVFTPVRQSQLTTERRNEEAQLKANEEKAREDQARRDQIAKEKAQRESESRMKQVALVAARYYKCEPRDRGAVISEYMLLRGFSQNETGIRQAIDELNDPKVMQAVLGGQ